MGGGPFSKFGDRVEEQVLMAHHHHRHGAAEHRAHLARIVTRRVYHLFAAHLALGCHDNPFIAFAPHTGHGAEAFDARAHLPRALGQGLGQLRGVDIAIVGIVERALKVMGFKEGIAPAHLVGAQQIQIHALVTAHADDAGEFLHSFAAMAQAQRSGDMVVHRVIDLGAQTAIEIGRIALHVHDRPTG